MSPPKRLSAFDEAAADLGISPAVLTLWVLERHANDISISRWSQFRHGHEPIPDKWIREYLRDRRAHEPGRAGLVAELTAQIADTLPRAALPPAEIARRAAHLSNQIAVLFGPIVVEGEPERRLLDRASIVPAPPPARRGSRRQGTKASTD